MIFYITFI